MKYLKTYESKLDLYKEISEREYFYAKSIPMENRNKLYLLELLKDYHPKYNNPFIVFMLNHDPEYIFQMDDEYFLFTYGNFRYKCDGIDGLTELLKSKHII